MSSAAQIFRSARSPRAQVEELVRAGTIRSAYQPLIDLQSREITGYEALARGPHGSVLERPDALFDAAATAGLELEVEWQCQRAALEGALAAGLPAGHSLFVNFEPRLLAAGRPDWLAELLERAMGRFAIFAEVTERSLTDGAAGLLEAVARLRAFGLRIALDDVGTDPRSLAMMPFLNPEVIKLDLSLVQGEPTSQVAEVVHAVAAESERTGALVLAEGIETEAHHQTALALGARYGQGWLFGRPAALEGPLEVPASPIAHRHSRTSDARTTPFGVVSVCRETRVGDKRLLLGLSKQIETTAAGLGPSAVILSTFQDAAYFSAAARDRYIDMASRAALVGALGVGLSEQPGPGVRGASFAEADPLRGEWDVVVIAPQFAAAFVAYDLGDDGDDSRRRFQFALTYERELVGHAARALMQRLAAV